MSTITTEATLEPDGVTLHLDRKVALPAGRVTVIVQSMGQGSGPSMLDVLHRIHQDQKLRARKPMTDEEMAAEIAAMRAEDEEYQDRCRKICEQTDA